MCIVDLGIDECKSISNEVILVKHTFVANFKLVKVSLRCASNGLTITNMSVLEFPPSEYCSR